MKKTYETPELVKHGSIEDLTQVGINGPTDDDGFASVDI